MIRFWFLRFDALDRERLRRAESWLDPEERARASAIRDPLGRGEQAGGRALARWCLSRCAPLAPERWRFVEDSRGRPWVDPRQLEGAGLWFSLSRTSGMAVCAVRLGGSVGADVEWDRGSAAAEPWELWTAREAVAKGCGLGLEAAMDPGLSLGDGRFRLPDGALWRAVRVRVPDGWVASLAVPGEAMPQVVAEDAVRAGFGTIEP